MSGTITDPGNYQSAQGWLDALSNEECDENEFMRAVQQLIRENQDAGWDLLSFLDQYYRRGKIKPEVFRSVKSNLERTLLGAADIQESVSDMREDSPSAPGLRAPTIASSERVADPPLTPGPPPASAVPDIPTATGGENAAPARHARPEIAVGALLRGRYQLSSVLHRGGMGTLFEAVDQYRLDLPDATPRLALKVPNRDVMQRPESLTELRREFQRLQSLSHPNIVRVHEYDRDGDTAFFTMEYLSGLSLTRLLAARHQAALKRADARSIFRDVGAALSHAHHRGILHGNLNSGNILITDDGEVRVLGFGAPEGEAADLRDDLYAFACVVYLLLAGELPFEGHSASRARTLGLRPNRPPGLTGRQWRALRSSLDFERDRRPADVDEFLRPFELGRTAARTPAALAPLKVSAPSRNPKRWLALGAAASIILAAGWWVTTNYDSVASTASAWRLALVGVLGNAETSTSRLRRSTGEDPVVAHSRPEPQAAPPHPAEAATSPVPAAVSNAPASSPEPAPQTETAAPRASLPERSTTQRSRIELAASVFEVPFGDPSAHIVVRRSGSLQTEMNFSWWTETGTAKPGKDYEAVVPHVETIAAGKNAVSLFVPVVTDLKRRQSTNFYVVISDPSTNVSLGTRTVAMVSIEPSQ